MEIHPLPCHTLVTGRTTDGLWARSSCKGHVWMLGPATEVPRERAGSGWVQSATCVVCCTDCVPVDIEMWQEAADDAYIEECIQMMEATSVRYSIVIETVLAKRTQPQQYAPVD